MQWDLRFKHCIVLSIRRQNYEISIYWRNYNYWWSTITPFLIITFTMTLLIFLESCTLYYFKYGIFNIIYAVITSYLFGPDYINHPIYKGRKALYWQTWNRSFMATISIKMVKPLLWFVRGLKWLSVTIILEWI